MIVDEAPDLKVGGWRESLKALVDAGEARILAEAEAQKEKKIKEKKPKVTLSLMRLIKKYQQANSYAPPWKSRSRMIPPTGKAIFTLANESMCALLFTAIRFVQGVRDRLTILVVFSAQNAKPEGKRPVNKLKMSL